MNKEDIKAYLNELYPDAHCELNYTNHYELLIAVILSAQTTDAKVNSVTKVLFKDYPSFEMLKNADMNEVISTLKSLGLANSKAKNIINCAKTICDTYGGSIPNEKKELLNLSGVGEKVACVFLAEGLGINEFPVDTHVKRIATRLGLTKEADPTKIEYDLKKYFKGDDWHMLHHQFIFFGRYKCKAVSPDCAGCKFKEICKK